MKRIISIVAALVIMITGMSFMMSETAQAVSYESGLDIVVVIDRSGTMRTSDPNNTALSVAKSLADVSSNDAVQTSANGGVSMAVVPYGYDLSYSKDDFRFYNVSNAQQRDALKENLDSLNTVTYNEDTNTGLALRKAYELLESRKAEYPNHSCAVLLLSDGEVDVGDSNGFQNRNKNLSYQLLQKRKEIEIQESIEMGNEASRNLKNNDIKLHCVGIYAQSKDKLGIDMERWATETGGLYRTTKSSQNNDELKKFANEIYLEINPHARIDTYHIGRDGGYFTIEEGILQANIQVSPSFTNSSNVTLTHIENRNEIPYPITNANIRQSSTNTQQNTYTVISLPNPAPGTYKIKINDGNKYEFTLTVFSIRDLLMMVDPIDDVQNGDTLRINLTVTKDGTAYDGINEFPKVTITNNDANQIAINKVPMTQDPLTPGSYYYDYATTQMGNYTVQAQMMKDGYVNYSNSVSFEVTASPVRPVAHAPNYSFTGHAITAYDVNNREFKPYGELYITYQDLESSCFTNPDGQVITGFSAYDNSGYLEIVNDSNNGQIIIKPLRSTEGSTVTFEIKAHFLGTESQPLLPTVYIDDLQAPIKRASGLTFVDSMEFAEIKGILPREVIPETIATDEHAVVRFDDVEAFFVEPNANDGEHFAIACDIEDANGDATTGLEWRIDEANGKKALYLKGVKEGEYKVTMTATSYDSSKESVTFTVSVKDMLMTYIIIGGIALFALLLLVLIIRAAVVGPKPPFRHAMLNVVLEYDGDSEEGSVMLQRYGKKSVKLSTLCSNNGIRTGKLRKNLEQITVSPKKNGGIHVHVNIKGVQVKDVVLHSMDSRTIELDPNGDRIIELEYDENASDD